MKKRRNYAFLSIAMYFVAVVVIVCTMIGVFPIYSLLGAVFCVALGGTLSGAQANIDFNNEVAERERLREERREKRRSRR